MKLVSTAAQVREMDRRVIEGLGLPGIALMETASRSVARAIARRHRAEAEQGVVVVCGGGNNGGDGYACARWLHGWGLPVQVYPLKEQLSGDAAINRDACKRLGVPFTDGLGKAGLLVDAVFGTGLDRPVGGRYRGVIEAMTGHPAPVVAVDLPSGIHADTGAVLGVAVPCVTTVTFGRLKLGLLGEPGADYAGAVEVADIGIEDGSAEAIAEIPEPEDLAPLWPRRAPSDHKTRSGHLLVVAGSEAMTGAAILACRGALAAGVGLLTVVGCRGMLSRLAGLPPEAMMVVSGDGARSEPVPAKVLERHTAVAAGPGLGAGGPLVGTMGDWLQHLWETSGLPLVYDADALPHTQGGSAAPRLITPHPGEAGRLLGASVHEVQADRFTAARQLASDGKVALLKGRNSLVAAERARISVNAANSPVLGTGGSGDVLTGVLGALLARGVSARDAARLGAWVHGRAAQLLEAQRSQGWTTADVAAAIPVAIEELLTA
jgi:NAD(P)H-hydrate epimerase